MCDEKKAIVVIGRMWLATISSSGKRLQMLRNLKGWSAMRMWEAMPKPKAVSYGYYLKMESGEVPLSAEVALQVATLLTTTTDFLLCRTDNPEQPSPSLGVSPGVPLNPSDELVTFGTAS